MDNTMMFGILGLAMLFIVPTLLGVIFPLWISLLIAKNLFTKQLSIKFFLPFGISIVSLLILANFLWDSLVFNHIYYEWDRTFFPPLTLLHHEIPVLDGMGTWIAQGWSLFSLHLLHYAILLVIYSLSIILSLWWFSRKTKESVANLQKTLITTAILLFISAILFTNFSHYVGKLVSNLFYKPIQRAENNIQCIPPTQPNQQIYFGGVGADFISSKDGKTRNIWTKNGGGYPSGVISPDSSAVAYTDTNTEGDVIWVVCTENEGMYRIPFPPQKISGVNVHIYNVSPVWSPDSTQLVLNFAGDLIKVDVFNKQKEVIYPKIAVKDFGIDPTKPRPSGFLSYYQTGSVYWAEDGTVYYEKFLDDTVELRALYPDDKDEVVFTSKFPLSIEKVSNEPDKLLITESDWTSPGHNTNFHSDRYIYNILTKQREGLLYGETLRNQNIYPIRQFQVTLDRKYLVISTGGIGMIDTNNEMELLIKELSTNTIIDIKAKMKTYLRNNGLSTPEEVVSITGIGVSNSNELLIYVTYGDYTKSSATYISDITGESIQLVFQDADRKDSSNKDGKASLMPKGWL